MRIADCGLRKVVERDLRARYRRRRCVFVIPSKMKRSVMKPRNLSLLPAFVCKTVRDVSRLRSTTARQATPLDMTRRLTALALLGLAAISCSLAQESPTLSSSPDTSQTPSVTPAPSLTPTLGATPTETATLTPPTPSPSPARSVRITFLPPPMEGKI